LLAPAGRLLVETYGVAGGAAGIEVHPPGGVYPGDEYVYWGFSADALDALAAHAGFARVTVDARPAIDGHPRILATLARHGA
jgi:hypothetical protein